MIIVEEKTRERFLERNNRDNPDRQNHQNNGHQDRKRGPDNTVVVADIENMHYIWHPNGNHMTRDCRIFIDRYTRNGNNGKRKEDNQKDEQSRR
jgi:hypothetical protein